MWQLRGRYPNRGYPKIFNDPTVGPEAKKLFAEVQEMLADFVKNKRVELNGIVGFYPANSDGDDIEVRLQNSLCRRWGEGGCRQNGLCWAASFSSAICASGYCRCQQTAPAC